MEVTTDKAVARLLVQAAKKGMISHDKVEEIYNLFSDLAVDFALEAEANSGSKLEYKRADLAQRLADQLDEEGA